MSITKKTIWVLNMTAGKPDSGWGERHVFLARHWVKKGFNVKIVSGSFNHLFTEQPKIIKQFTIEPIEEGIDFCWVKIPNYKNTGYLKMWSMLIYSFKVLFLNFKTLGIPDIILVSSMPVFASLSGFLLSRKYKAKYIFEIRDLWPLTPIYLKNYSKYHPLILLMFWFEKIGYKKSDYIVSVLPNANLYIDKISGDSNKFHWIPNGIYIDDSKYAIEDSIKKLVPENKFIVTYTGTVGMANAMEYFIEAAILMKENLNIHFLIVGNGYLINSLKEQTKELNTITFIPKIPKKYVQSVLKLSDVCYVGRYHSKLYEYGVSYNKYFDYMLSGKPVLESSAHIKDPVELSGCGIIVKPEDPDAIVKGILRLYHMTAEERQTLGQKGYDYVLKYHTYKYLSEQYLQLFK